MHIWFVAALSRVNVFQRAYKQKVRYYNQLYSCEIYKSIPKNPGKKVK